MLEFLTDREIYDKVICGMVPKAREYLWLGTSDLKDMYVDHHNKMVPFLKVLQELSEKNIAIRLIHAKEPGENFRKDFDCYPLLWKTMERACCPRVHFKCVIVDGRWAYTGSANLTGAGIGAKSSNRRNFENGFLTDEQKIIEKLMDEFDKVWNGSQCKMCGRKTMCGDKIDVL